MSMRYPNTSRQSGEPPYGVDWKAYATPIKDEHTKHVRDALTDDPRGQVRQRAEVLHRGDALGRQLGWAVGATVRTNFTHMASGE